jgi:RimJ/RimL family protein N-acetyltransferase
MPRTLSSDRLVLRPFKTTDAQAVAAQVGSLETARWLTRVPHPYDIENGRDFIARMSDEPLVFAVTVAGDLIGCVAITDELGYWIGADWRRRGYASEAARTLVTHYFEEGGEDLWSGHVLGNMTSRRIFLGLGFEDHEVRQIPSCSLGKDVPVQKMYLSANTWAGLS